MKKAVHTGNDTVLPVTYFKNLVITLGFSAIVINIAMNLAYLLLIVTGNAKKITSWLVIVNFLFLILQVYYFFIYTD